MENISRAIIIAGGMLLAVLILSIMVFMYNRIVIIPQEQVQQYDELGIVEYNRSYEVYQKPLMYGTDIISIINKAVDHNMRNGLLTANSNFFSRAFSNPVDGGLMTIEAEFKSSLSELDFTTRVRIYYVPTTNNEEKREKEYRIGEEIPNHKGKRIKDVLSGAQYEKLLGTEVYNAKFMPEEYPYDIAREGRGFFTVKGSKVYLVAGDVNADVKSNKALMKFMEAEPVTILNPDPHDKSWTRMVIQPPSAKLKRLIFKSLDDQTEYYQNGRIKKMNFEEIK